MLMPVWLNHSKALGLKPSKQSCFPVAWITRSSHGHRLCFQQESMLVHWYTNIRRWTFARFLNQPIPIKAWANWTIHTGRDVDVPLSTTPLFFLKRSWCRGGRGVKGLYGTKILAFASSMRQKKLERRYAIFSHFFAKIFSMHFGKHPKYARSMIKYVIF